MTTQGNDELDDIILELMGCDMSQEQKRIYREDYMFFKAKAAIQAYAANKAREAKVQTALDIATRLKLEFIKRNLSSDTMPEGYRKLTDAELIMRVCGDFCELNKETE